MSILKIKDLTEQIRGVSYKPSDVVTSDIGLPILRANNIKDNSLSFDDLVFIKPEKVSKKQLLQNGDIVICASSGSKELVGKAGVFCNNDTYSFGAFCKAVRVKRIDGIDSDYVRLYFSSKYYRECIALSSKGSNINNIKTENIEELNINIPSIEEQNTAVSLLNALISAIDNKKQELFSLDELVKSRFIEMFGEPLSESYTTPLSQACIFNPKKSEKKDWTDETLISFIPMPLVSEHGEINTETLKTYKEVKTGFTYFRENDVLFAKITPCMENGKGAIAQNLKNGIGFGSTEFHVLRPIEGVSNPYWIYYLTAIDSFRIMAEKKMTGSAGQKRVPISFFENMKVNLPPIELQNEFAEFVKLIDKSKFIVQQQIKDLQELLDSKMDEYFR